MNKKIVALIVVVILGTSALLAHPGNQQRRAERRDNIQRLAEKLELTPGQIEQIRQLRETQRAKQSELRDDMRSVAVEYRNLRDASDPAAERAMTRLRALRDESMARRVAGRADIAQILTPEQRERIRQGRRRE